MLVIIKAWVSGKLDSLCFTWPLKRSFGWGLQIRFRISIIFFYSKWEFISRKGKVKVKTITKYFSRYCASKMLTSISDILGEWGIGEYLSCPRAQHVFFFLNQVHWCPNTLFLGLWMLNLYSGQIMDVCRVPESTSSNSYSSS